MKHLTFEELYQTNCEEVIAIVSGYMERSLIGDYFQPLSGKREITFILWKSNPSLYHKRFWFDNEDNETFYEENGKYYCNEPDISCKRYE